MSAPAMNGTMGDVCVVLVWKLRKQLICDHGISRVRIRVVLVGSNDTSLMSVVLDSPVPK